MVRHEAACRRWRACVAMHNMLIPRESRFCGSSRRLGEYPERLSALISALQSSDEVLKMEAVHHLALFLLYVAPTSESTFTCPDAQTISLHFQSRSILLALKDIQILYKLTFWELAHYVAWLFKQECGRKDSGQIVFNCACSSHCVCFNMQFIVKILQCCIYILPLLEFNTGLSLVAADALHSLFKQLVCPANLFCLSLKEFDEMVDNYRMFLAKRPYSCYRVKDICSFAGLHSNPPGVHISSFEALIKDMLENLQGHENLDLFISDLSHKKSISCHSNDKKMHTDRGQLALAVLEVFMEELLLQPHLADILKASNALISSDNQTSPEKHVLLTVEAAAMHFTFSVLAIDHAEVLHRSVDHESFIHHGSRLSLPAAVMLLDLSMLDDIRAPDMFLVHIVNMLRCSLNTSCLKEELSGEMVLGFTASALESAIDLYLKCWKSNSLPVNHSSLQRGVLLECLFDKFWAMYDGNVKKVAALLDLLFDQENQKALQQESGSRHSCLHCFGAELSVGYEMLQCSSCSRHSNSTIHSDHEKEQLLPTQCSSYSPSEALFMGTNTTLLVPVLHLISTALLYLVMEASKQSQLLKTLDGKEEIPLNAEVYIRDIKEVFKFCGQVDRMKVLQNLNLDKELLDVILEVDKLTGNAFTFFAERLLLCMRQGAPQALSHAYSEVLKSLLTLNYFKQGKDSLNLASADKLLHEAEIRPSPNVMVTNMEEEEATHVQEFKNECQQHIASSMSTLLMTKVYQRKHKNIVTTYRKNEMSVKNEQLKGGDQCRPESQEEGNLRKDEMITPKYRSSGNGDAYIKEVIACEGMVEGECFSDLSDFIVCKEGRNYSRWMKLRYKKRKKKVRRNLWQRMKAKRALVSLLTTGSKNCL